MGRVVFSLLADVDLVVGLREGEVESVVTVGLPREVVAEAGMTGV